jgi:hypothetical protein
LDREIHSGRLAAIEGSERPVEGSRGDAAMNSEKGGCFMGIGEV